MARIAKCRWLWRSEKLRAAHSDLLAHLLFVHHPARPRAWPTGLALGLTPGTLMKPRLAQVPVETVDFFRNSVTLRKSPAAIPSNPSLRTFCSMRTVPVHFEKPQKP